MNVACNSPDTVSHRAFISLELQRLRMLLKVHSIELHAKLLRGCALARTWARYLARGPDTWRVDPVVCAWAAPRRISRGWRACYGLTSMFSGSRASGTPGQAPLGPQRRAPCPRHAIVSVCYRSGLYCGRHTTPRRDLTALNRGLTALNRDLTAPNCDLTGSKRGNCASRGRMRDLLADDCAVKWGELHH
mgnify:FL=1